MVPVSISDPELLPDSNYDVDREEFILSRRKTLQMKLHSSYFPENSLQKYAFRGENSQARL